VLVDCSIRQRNLDVPARVRADETGRSSFATFAITIRNNE